MKAHDVEPELLGVDTGAPALPPSCLGHGPRVCVLLAYARALMLARPRLRCLGSLGVCVCACQLSCATPSQQHTFRVFCWRLPLGREVVNPLTGERLPVRPPAAPRALAIAARAIATAREFTSSPEATPGGRRAEKTLAAPRTGPALVLMNDGL